MSEYRQRTGDRQETASALPALYLFTLSPLRRGILTGSFLASLIAAFFSDQIRILPAFLALGFVFAEIAYNGSRRFGGGSSADVRASEGVLQACVVASIAALLGDHDQLVRVVVFIVIAALLSTIKLGRWRRGAPKSAR